MRSDALATVAGGGQRRSLGARRWRLIRRLAVFGGSIGRCGGGGGGGGAAPRVGIVAGVGG